MNKREIKKNKLDLEYHKNSQILNGMLIFLTSGVFGFIASLIYLDDKYKLLIGLVLSSVTLIVIYTFMKKVDKRMSEILEEVTEV